MKKYLVIDVGGTAIKYALMDEATNILDKGDLPTPHESLEAFIETIGTLYDQYQTHISGIAFSAPGRIDANTGYMYTGGAIRYIHETPMAELLTERCPIKISLENDGKCAALAELWKGSLKDVDHGVVLTIGTGIGGGIIVDKKLLRGHNFAAGELSGLPTTIDPKLDSVNFWAAINSTGSLTKAFADVRGYDPKQTSGKDFFTAIDHQDEDAWSILNEFCSTFANGLFAIQTVLDTQRVAIGGGISAQPALIETIQAKVDELFDRMPYMPQRRMEIVRCAFANDSNLIGALYHHLYE